MIAFTDIIVDIKEEDDIHGLYEIKPLPSGYGYTLANSLRRILLSSIEGAGITSVRIAGVEFEYSAIDGVKEDVIEILLNLKGLRFKSDSDSPVKVSIEASGKTVVTGEDIVCSGPVEVMNKDHVIAHLTDKESKLSMEMVVEKGVGYRNVDSTKREEVGLINVDTDFSPIQRVSFKVDSARKGQDAGYDSVIIDITTDGSIAPKSALLQSAEILQNFAGKIMAALGIAEDVIKQKAEESLEIETTEVDNSSQNDRTSEMDSWKIEDLPISRRAKSSLTAGGYKFLGDLRGVSVSELMALPGFGAKSRDEVVSLLDQYGFEVKKD